MANYYTKFSTTLLVGPGNVEAALALYAQMKADLEAMDTSIGFEAAKNEPDDDALWLWDGDGSGDIEQVISYVFQVAQACNLTGLWGFHWSLSCSRPRLGAFGGGAQMLDLGQRESLCWMDCEHWVAARTNVDGPCQVSAETALHPVADTEGWTEATQLCVLLGFIDSLIRADPAVADQLRFHLADVSAEPDDMPCRECGEPVFIADSGTLHHVGTGLDGTDYGRDRDHAALAEKEPRATDDRIITQVIDPRDCETAPTRVGRWYADGPDRVFVPGDPAFRIHRVVADDADVRGCVTVENAGGQRFPVPTSLIDAISAPAVQPARTLLDEPSEPGEHGS